MSVSFEDFKKLDLRIGRILEVERIEGSEKLLKLRVDIGDDPSSSSGQALSSSSGQRERQIIAGIAQYYTAEDLVGRLIPIVVNLEPRMMMGHESQGMLLAADDSGPVLFSPDKEVAPGSEIR